MSEEIELRAASGSVPEALRAEFPGLRLDWLTVSGQLRDSPREITARLEKLSDGYRGASVVALRAQPVPQAYRIFFRQIGLDPDVNRIPAEQAALTRLVQGQFRPRDLVSDALLIALIETAVPVWALDADGLDVGGLGIRVSRAGDRLGASEHGHHVPPGRLVVCDARSVHALLFGELAPGHQVTRRTRRIALFAVGVPGVPAIHVEEALWVAQEALAASGPG